MFRFLIRFLPGGVTLAAALALVLGFGSPELKETVATAYPWVVFAAALFMGVFFHRSRVVVGVLALSVTAGVASTGAGGVTALHFLGGLTALLLGLSSLLRDCGVFSTAGLLQLGAVLVPGFFGGLFLAVAPQDMAVFLAAMPFPGALSLWSGLPQPVFLTLALALPGSLGVALFRGGAVDRGLFWTLLLLALALSFSHDAAAVAIFLMGGGLTLGLSVVETSHAMAYRDDLTGLPARRALTRDMEGLGGTYSVAMVDVDHFKRFNDRHGHDVGDQVLRMVAGRLAQAPGGGRAFRYGGEEFTLIFPGKTRQEVVPLLDVVREDVANSTFTLRSWRRPRKKPVNPGAWKSPGAGQPRGLSVTVSIGVADSTGKDPSPEAVLKRADEALYRAKKGGRNRVAR